jgi:hypothetical protein
MANYQPTRGPVPGTAAAVRANNARRRYESEQAKVAEAQDRLNALRAAARQTTHANRFGSLSQVGAVVALRAAQARSVSQR